MFLVDNQKHFLTNAYVQGLDTRNKNHLYLPAVSLSCVQKGVSYSGVKHIKAIKRVIEITEKIQKQVILIPYYSFLLFSY